MRSALLAAGATALGLVVGIALGKREDPERERAATLPARELRAALATIRAQGFDVPDKTTYYREHRLRVLIGWPRKRGATMPPQQAFFFDRDRFVGTDERASGLVRVMWADGETVALSYDIWRPTDANCCPTGGAVTVRYRLRGGEVVPLDPVPPSGRSFAHG